MSASHTRGARARARAALLLPLLALPVACSSSPSGRMCATQSPDIDLFQAIQAGTLTVADGLKKVALSEGWPIEGCTGYLFALPDPDGRLAPYSVESPSNAFPRVGMTSAGGVAWAIVPIAFPENATYVYTAFDGRVVPDLWSRRFTWDGGAQVSLVRTTAGAHFERWPQLGDVTGAIGPRELKVWVPPQAPTRVLYAHDGQEAFGPGLALPSLVGPATLVVGIDADPAARLQEYQAAADFGPDGGPVGQRSNAYVDYVQNVVRPLVEGHYGRPARSALLGCGAGGSAALKQPVRFPDTWDLVAGISGDYGVGHLRATNATLAEQWTALRSCPLGQVYLGVGGEAPDGGCRDLDGDGLWDDPPGAQDSVCQTRQLERSLAALGCADRLTVDQVVGGERCGATLRTLAPRVISRLEAP